MKKGRGIFTPEKSVRDLCLKLKSICIGADSKFFNGHTNITSNRFICFGTKGITDADTAIRNAMLFNVLSFMSDALLSKGNTAAFIDELYLFLTNMTAIEYIRNAMKRVRKKGSAVIIASQNIEDFNRADVREMTKPCLPFQHISFYLIQEISPRRNIWKCSGWMIVCSI